MSHLVGVRRRAVLMVLLTAAGLVVAVPDTAEAKLVQNGKVGTISGFYRSVSEGGPEYYGTKFRANPGECVDVERKTLSTGAWTTSGVYLYRSCDGQPSSWQIRNADYISNTTAIRLVDIGTKDTSHPEYVVLCSTKSACLAM